ncbi:KR domain-containing protein [Streptomyces durbertensis]|uniref:KR domain-containing protein n=1 Tax=Streptomyces durbertensis TaxID=2448886 RepID=A0ABR6EAK4_9ACTN|nr:beta-ketoacyl synthase N-terminal-like domain-containing protein [Streptomyces durbertensis]MBB1242379.1 KR domain-containing protein [Streptomyces durbertensis]
MKHDQLPNDAASDPNAVAVVGLSCRFGPATSADRLWKLLAEGGSGIRRYSDEELVRMGHDPAVVRRPGFVPAGVVLEEADAFDAEFFGYSPLHAEWLEPQQRILLETAWHALEDAGFAPDRTGLRTAAYVSVGQPTTPPVGITELDAAGMIRFSSTDKDFAANRISYKLGLTGPSMTVQTACSSGLVGVHLAVESLLGEECDLAVVGAASLHFPQAGYLAAPDMILSPSGECRPFDDTSDGTLFGNGTGAVVLRRLADAVADGDPIRAVIRGSAVNNDGARKMDYHAPSPEGQEAVLREALAVAGVPAHTVGYLETHGTGTPLGDPVEYAALDRVYGGDRAHPASIGSVKSVLGHLNTAAGLAGLSKAVLALEHGVVPPQRPFGTPNRRLGGTGGLRVATEPEAWPVPDGPRRAAVSSFGIGGTNAHVVLEQAPNRRDTVGDDRAENSPDHWIVLSARSEDALRRTARELAESLRAVDAPPLVDVAHTLRAGRSLHAVRAAVSVGSTADLTEWLDRLADAGPDTALTGLDGAYLTWVQGGELPPEEGRKGRRVRLPGYPFARRRWPRHPETVVGRTALPSDTAPAAATDADPVTRTVRPEEPLAAHHLVGGVPVLPAAAQIDLALTSARRTGRSPVGLADVSFQRSVEVLLPITLTVEHEDGRLRVVSERAHAEARPLYDAVTPRPAPLDLAALRADHPHTAQPDDLYRYFEANGVGYGPAFQVLRELHHGPGGVLTRVVAAPGAPAGSTLSPVVLDGALQSVIGCVLREDLGGETFIPFAVDELRTYAPLPDEAWVRVRPQRLAGGGRRVRKYDVFVAADDGAVVLTLDGLALRPTAAPTLADVHLFTPVEVPFEPAGARDDRVASGPLVLVGDPTVTGAGVLDGVDLTLPEPADPEAAAATGAELADLLPADGRPTIVWPVTAARQPRDAAAGPVTAQASAAADAGLRMLALLRALLRPLARRGARIVVPCPADNSEASVQAAGLAAVGRSLAGENPRFELVVVALGAPGSPEADTGRAGLRNVLDVLDRGVPDSGELVVRPADEHPRTTVLAAVEPPAPGGPAFRRGGRYWLHGMGRLAVLLAEHLLDRYAAHVVLTGRTAADGARGAELRRLTERAARTGGSVAYLSVDATDFAAVRQTAARIAAGGPAVNGVLHCAGTLRDGYVLRKTTADASAVIGPKLVGAAALDEATAAWDLDCFVVLSSVSGALGSAGQADYAFANAAADELVRRRAASTRSGRSLSVCWPFWADGGMRVDGPAQEVLGALGMRALPTATGLAVLERLLAGSAAGDAREAGPVSPVVLYGDRAALLDSFPLLTESEAGPRPTVDVAAPVEGSPAADGTARPRLSEALTRRLVEVVAEATRSPLAEVAPERLFDDLGIDSLLAIRVVELLEADFGRLSKTLLFECRSVAELAEYLLAEYPERCAALVPESEPAAVPETPRSSDAAVESRARAHAPTPGAQVQPRAAGSGAAGSGADTAAAAGPGSRSEAVDPRAVAIIGVSGRFPEADGLEELWENLTAGRDSIREVPTDRWDAEAMYDPDKTRVDRTHTKWGGFLEGVQDFDAPLFNISPREAGIIDPQARLFLESCWAALEDAGYTPDRLVSADDPVYRRDVGVFVGAMYGEYQLHEAEERLRGNPVLANSAYWSIANRASYFFDFQGPSVAVDTACSSALSAIHLAVESLRAGSCRVALAGGVNVLIHPNKYFMLGQGRFASSDGRCRSFGAGGDGYVPGEGVGTVVLKPLRDALRDGDHIHGVVRGTAANHGGRTNGYTVPNPRAQADLVTKALRDGGLTAADLDYVETHGTGTSLGDPIEIRGLATAFARDGVKGDGDLPIGSVKSNVGHLESAAGSVALTKVLLQLRHRTLVPSLHCDPPNPEIDFDRVPFTVQRGVKSWEPRDGSGRPLRAGISSFGAGGGNAHLVVEEAPRRGREVRAAQREPLVLFLSARTAAALAAYARELRDHLIRERERGQEPDIADVVLTFAVGRVDLAQRAALPADSFDMLLAGLDALAENRQPPAPPVNEVVAGWLAGGRVDRAAACGAATTGRRIPLPHYPFERVRCWYDLQISHLHRQGLGTVSAEPELARGHLRDFGRRPATDAARPIDAASPARPAVPAGPASPARPVGPVGVPAPALTLHGAAAPLKATSHHRENPPMSADRKITLRQLAPPASPVPTSTVSAAPARPAPTPAASSPATPAGGVASRGEEAVATEIARLLATVLYLEPDELDMEATFLTLGVDSILGVEFVAAVNKVYPVDVKATALYDHPTPMAFARHVAGRRGAPTDMTSPGGAEVPAPPVTTVTASSAPTGGPAVDEIAAVLREELARTLYCEPADIDDEASFNTLGLDSILGVEFVAFLNRTHGLEEKAGVLYDHPSLGALSRHVAALATTGTPPVPEPAGTAGPPSPPVGGPSATDVDALLNAVRENRLTIEQALALLPPRN